MHFTPSIARCMTGLLGIIALASNNALSAGIDDLKLYELESGRITYTLSGFQSGTETLTWIEHGRKTRRETVRKMRFMGMTQEQKETVVTDGLWIYNVNHNTQTATKMENPMFKSLVAQGRTDMLKTGEDLMRAMKGRIVGKKTILGKPCVKWLVEQMMNMTTCVWRGIALMTQGGMPGMEIIQTATEIKTGGVSADAVALPAGIRVIEGTDPMKQLQDMRQPRSFSPPPGMGGSPKNGTKNQDPMKLLEQFKKMQEQMKKQGGMPE